MVSIRRKLLNSILLVVFAVTLLLATITYFSVREEMDEFYDKNLEQVAHIILGTRPAGDRPVDPNVQGPKLRGEEKYLTQVWRDGVLEFSSYPHIDFPLQKADGKGKTSFNGGVWRFYRETAGETTVQLAQDLKERHSVVLEIYGFLLIPIIIQFPILAALIWILIGYGLKPLGDISSLIKNRNPSFLAPLPNDSIPVEISILVNELNDLLERLKQALESQRRFTADAAHELRTPLTAVRLQLDVLKRADNESETKAAVATLEQGVLRSTRLVHQLLEMARQEPENLEQSFSRVDLAKIVDECIEQISPMSQSKEIMLECEILDRPTLTGSAAKLAVMINNLIGNAISYTGRGGRIRVVLRTENGEPVLEISDNGVGIPPDQRERIFDRFYRVPGTSATGSGLGLSIVQSIAAQHKASIRVGDGLEGRGTKFEIHFNSSLED